MPYKRVIARLRRSKQNVSLEREQAENVIGKLFLNEDMGVANENVTENDGGGTSGAGDVVQMDELKAAVGRLNVNKAVGIDGVPGSVIKLIFEH